MKICRGPECGRPVTALGLCATHYLMQRRTGELKPIRKQKNSVSDEELRAEKAAKKLGRPRIEMGMCEGPECDREAKVVTPQPLCSAHYNQQNAGKPLTPIKRKSPRQEADAPQRRCSVCQRIKDTDDFHTRTNGKPQSECKVCVKYRARLNFLKRTDQHDRAGVVQAVWTAYVRVVNTGWVHDPQTKKKAGEGK